MLAETSTQGDQANIEFLSYSVCAICSRKLPFGEQANRISEDLVICDYCYGAD